MSYLIEIPMESGESLLVSSAGQVPVGLQLASSTDQVVAKAEETLEAALDRLRPALAKIAAQLKSHKPQELSVEFGLTVDGKCGILVASGEVEIAFKVAMVWKSAGDVSE